MFSKIDVNGDTAHDLYKWLKSEQSLEDGANDVRWNFEKFLVDRAGRVAARFAPMVTPEDIAAQLDAYL